MKPSRRDWQSRRNLQQTGQHLKSSTDPRLESGKSGKASKKRGNAGRTVFMRCVCASIDRYSQKEENHDRNDFQEREPILQLGEKHSEVSLVTTHKKKKLTYFAIKFNVDQIYRNQEHPKEDGRQPVVFVRYK